MRSLWTGTLLSLYAAAVMLAQENGEQKLTSSDVPPAVSAAAAKKYSHARISAWSKELEDGRVTYEASLIDRGSKRDAVFASDGSLVAVETAIPIAQLPSEVKASLQKKYPQAVLRQAERIVRGEDVQYEVDLRNAPKKEVLLSSSGKILKEE